MTIVELLVHMDCAGCETKIKKALQKLPGVDDVNIDIGMQKVSVMGWADQKKILKTVRKIGKKAELWPYPYNPQYQYHGFTSSQYNNYQNINYNYNYKNPSSSSSFNSYPAISMKPSSSPTTTTFTAIIMVTTLATTKRLLDQQLSMTMPYPSLVMITLMLVL